MDNWSNKEVQINRYWSCNVLFLNTNAIIYNYKGIMTPMGNHFFMVLGCSCFYKCTTNELKKQLKCV